MLHRAMNRIDLVARKVDGFFARVQARHGDDMQCGSGCADCCHVRLSITGVEADAIRELVATWPAEQRRALADVADPARCAALDAAGRCKVYDARPLVCRSHGAPVRLGDRVESCFRNFTHTTPDPDCVLDQTTLSALALAADREAGGTGARIELAALVAELADL
jgi:uncharacterized protein